MIPTLRWALLKNSGLRSMGMGRVALLLDGTSGRTEVTKSHIFRDACSPVTFIQASQRESRAIGQRQVNITGSPKNQKMRSEEHTSELQSRLHLVCRLLLEKKKKTNIVDDYRPLYKQLVINIHCVRFNQNRYIIANCLQETCSYDLE